MLQTSIYRKVFLKIKRAFSDSFIMRIKFVLLILALGWTGHVSSQKKPTIKQLYPEADDTITCQLEYLARVSYENGKITKTAIKEKAKISSVFTDLKSKTPKMIKPDKADLIKIKELKGVYWLLSNDAVYATVLFIIDTKKKIMIQQRAANINMLGLFYGQSWMGKCI